MRFQKISTIVILFFLAPFNNFAQNSDKVKKDIPRKNVVKLDLLSPWTSAFFGSLERSIYKGYSIQINYGYRTKAESGSGNFFIPGRRENLITLDNRFYFNDGAGFEPVEGFYCGPYLRYLSSFRGNVSRVFDHDLPDGSGTEELNIQQDETITKYGLGVVAGFQSISFTGWTIDCFMGLGFYPGIIVSADYPEAVQDYEISKTGFRLGFQLGYSF